MREIRPYTETEERQMKVMLDNMLKSSYQKLDRKDKFLIRKAFRVAKAAHASQRRKSGEPYIVSVLIVGK